METMQGQRTDETVAEALAMIAMVESEMPTERTPAFPISILAELLPRVATVDPIIAPSTTDEMVLAFQPKIRRWAVGLGFVPFTGVAIQQIAMGGPLATASLWWLATMIPAVGWTAWNARRGDN